MQASLNADRVDLMGCPVDGLTLRQTVARVRELVRRGEPTQHMCVNANKVVQGRVDRTRKSLAGHGIEAATVDARGARRSTRQRFRPLEWWRNEKVEYGRPIGSLPTVTEVSVRSPDPMWPTYKKNSGTSRDR